MSKISFFKNLEYYFWAMKDSVKCRVFINLEKNINTIKGYRRFNSFRLLIAT
jgi:hypothetical protein